MICANVVHIVLDWTLIFGNLGFSPGWELGGIRHRRCELERGRFSGLRGFIAEIFARGFAFNLPAPADTGMGPGESSRSGFRPRSRRCCASLPVMSFTGVLARTAEHMSGVAALPIGLTAESIAFMPGFGYSIAASALVGQSLGAKDPDGPSGMDGRQRGRLWRS